MFDSLSLTEELLSGLLHASLGDLVVEVKASHWGVNSVLANAGEGEHEASGNVVELAVSLEGNGLPLFTAVNPVAHVVDSGVTSGGSGRELSELNDLGSTLLNAGGELISDP